MEVTIHDNSEEFLNALPEQIEAGLLAIGLTAETNAKSEVDRAVYDTPESENYVRTGRLRNSLTFALGGKEAHISSYSDNTGGSYGYSGTAPDDPEHVKCVYIGSNVEYAAFV